MFGWIPLPRSLDASLRDAAHAKASIRTSAISDLVRWADGDARLQCIETLIRLLRHDGDDEVRAAAAVALADATAREALPALLDTALSDRPRVRQMVLLALGEVAEPGDAAACEAVRAGLASDAPAIRFQALVAANRLLPAEALLAPLRSALAAEEPRLRYVACRIVEERFLSETAPVTGHLPRPGDDAAALAALVDGCLDDSDADVALAAALAQARRGSPRAAERVARALNARRRFTHLDDEHAAVELCGQLGVSAAGPGLRARAWGSWLSGPSQLSFQARVSLARLGDARAREHILRGLSSRSRLVRTQSAAAAGQAQLLDAREQLCSMRGDESRADGQIVDEALGALGDGHGSRAS